MEYLLLVPTVLAVGKIIGGIVLFFIAIGFIPGLIIGWLVGHNT